MEEQQLDNVRKIILDRASTIFEDSDASTEVRTLLNVSLIVLALVYIGDCIREKK